MPWIARRLRRARATFVTLGCSLGAYHAANFALKRADLFPLALCLSGNYDPTAWNAWGEPRRRDLLQQPDGLRRRTCTAITWTGCAAASSLLLVVGQGAWEVHPTGALPSTRAFADLLSEKGIRHELDVWGYDVPTTGRRGGPSSRHHLPRFC